MSSAGPPENADARKRGASIAVIQKGLAARPEYRNAVTVWMLIAQGIDKIMIGFIHPGGGAPFFSDAMTLIEMITFSTRYPPRAMVSQ